MKASLRSVIAGSAYWKQNSRKVFAVPEEQRDLLQVNKRRRLGLVKIIEIYIFHIMFLFDTFHFKCHNDINYCHRLCVK